MKLIDFSPAYQAKRLKGNLVIEKYHISGIGFLYALYRVSSKKGEYLEVFHPLGLWYAGKKRVCDCWIVPKRYETCFLENWPKYQDEKEAFRNLSREQLIELFDKG